MSIAGSIAEFSGEEGVVAHPAKATRSDAKTVFLMLFREVFFIFCSL